MAENFSGYIEAEVIDRQIKALLQKYPIDDKNITEWYKFSQAMYTSVRILAEDAIAKARQSSVGHLLDMVRKLHESNVQERPKDGQAS